MDSDPTTSIALRAFRMPEIVLSIIPYLDTREVVACRSVSRSLRLAFEQFLWQDIHIGDMVYLSRWHRPRVRVFNKHFVLPEVQDALMKAAPLIKSLSIRKDESIFPLQLGELCSGIEKILLHGYVSEDYLEEGIDYRKMYESMVRRNQGRLKAIHLVDFKFRIAEPPWNLLEGCADRQEPWSLKLWACSISESSMPHFWNSCRRLQSLRIHFSDLELGSPSEQIREARLHCLQELVIQGVSYYGVRGPMGFLEQLVAQCPALRTLNWTLNTDITFPFKEFTDMFSASTWPELDSIKLEHFSGRISDECVYKLLEAPQNQDRHRSLRVLDIQKLIVSETMYNLYRAHHFGTLEDIDISMSPGYTSAWTIQIMTSCPSLRRFVSQVITAQEILISGPSWACHKLQEIYMMVDMKFEGNRAPYRKFTDQEMDQCRDVFKQLATLKELHTLDMNLRASTWLSKRLDREYYLFRLVPLPMRLKAGLDQLAGLKELAHVSFWKGRHSAYLKDVSWMLDHWRGLESISEGRLIKRQGFQSVPWDLNSGELGQLLRSRRVTTGGSVEYKYMEGDIADVELEDCCGESE